MAKHNELGKEGEAYAVDFLKKKGYTVLEQNWVHGKLEIDIISVYKGQIVFVEVKTRRNDLFSDPKDAVTFRKIRNLLRAADAYLKMNNVDLEPRFDIIEIIGNSGDFKIEHTEDAFVSPVM